MPMFRGPLGGKHTSLTLEMEIWESLPHWHWKLRGQLGSSGERI